MPEPLPRARGRGRLRRAFALAALALFVANCARDESTQAQQQRQQRQQQQPAQSQPPQNNRAPGTLLTGKDALGDWTTDAPGVRRRITLADLPKPFATESVDNGPRLVARPADAWPKAPAGFKNDAFAAQHGSWNRSRRTGYKVIRIPARDGVPTGEYEDFLVGFVTPAGDVWGRPVGVAVARDGALLVTDDGSNTVWRVSHQGR